MASIARGPVPVSTSKGVAPFPRIPRQRAQAPDRHTLDPGPATVPLLPWRGRSSQGRLVRVALEGGNYAGAACYYTVTYAKPSGGVQAIRYTPSRERARDLLTSFLRHVMDPGQLRTALPEARPIPTRDTGAGARRSPGSNAPGVRSGEAAREEESRHDAVRADPARRGQRVLAEGA